MRSPCPSHAPHRTANYVVRFSWGIRSLGHKAEKLEYQGCESQEHVKDSILTHTPVCPPSVRAKTRIPKLKSEASTHSAPRGMQEPQPARGGTAALISQAHFRTEGQCGTLPFLEWWGIFFFSEKVPIRGEEPTLASGWGPAAAPVGLLQQLPFPRELCCLRLGSSRCRVAATSPPTAPHGCLRLAELATTDPGGGTAWPPPKG